MTARATACDKPVQRLCLETLNVELDERGNAVLGDQRIQRRDLDVDGLAPALGFPAGASRAASTNAGDTDDTVGLSALISMRARAGARAPPPPLRSLRFAAPIKQPERLDHGRLRLDRDDPRAQPAERGDAVADMGADVEHQISAAGRSCHRAGPSPRPASCLRNKCETT